MLTTERPAKLYGGAEYALTPELLEACERVTHFGDEYSLGCEIGHKLILPRNLAPKPMVNDDFRVSAPCVPWKMRSDFKLKPGAQERIAPRLKHFLFTREDGFILQAGTGTGKTVMAIYGATVYEERTLIVVDQQNIMQQWYQQLLNLTTLTEKDIGFWQADKVPHPDCRVVIAMVHSICKVDRYPKELYERFGLAIFDEVHVMAAETFVTACSLIPARMRIGLSATPNRKDGKDELLFGHIGPIMIKEEGVPLAPKVLVVRSAFKVPMTVQIIDDEKVYRQVPHKPGKTGHITKMLAGSKDRNALIAKFCAMAYEKGRNIVVFSDLRDGHLFPIRDALLDAGLPDKDIDFFVGGMSQKKQDVAKRARIVLTTYKMTEKAVDCPWWDTAILATPRSDVRQTIGRVLREHPEKKDVREEHAPGTFPLVIDIVDDDSPVFANYLPKRLKYYRSIGGVLFGPKELIGESK